MRLDVSLLLGVVALCGAISLSSREAAAVPPLDAVNHRIRTASGDRCQTAVQSEGAVQSTTCGGGNLQRWHLNWLWGNTFTIENVGLSDSLQTPQCSTVTSLESGAVVTMNDCITDPEDGDPSTQRWDISPAGNDRYRICQTDTGTGVTYCTQAGFAGPNLQMRPLSGSSAQVWRFVP